jgi:hypothetical protein
MSDDTIEPFCFPAVGRKKVTAAFDGGRLTSDGGVMLLAAAERRLGVADELAALICDPRDPNLITHSVADILRARILAIACGYEDADDLDHLRSDPGFKLACGRLPDSGRNLYSQPTMSCWENAPTLRQVIRMTYAMFDIYCASYAHPPAAVTLDIDDTVDVVHGHQQMSLFNAHYDERCFLPIHVYETASSRPVTMLLRPGKTPSGEEVRGHIPRPGAPHPDALAEDAADHPRRWSLRPARGDDLVRGECGGRHLRSARQCRCRPLVPAQAHRNSRSPNVAARRATP